MKTLLASLLVAVNLWLIEGCNPSSDNLYAGFQHEDPAVRIRAIHRAGQAKDQAAVPYLVDRLTDSQQDVRFFAFLALRRITDQTMEWRYHDTPDKQAEAVRRWRQWLADERKGKPDTQADAGGPAKVEATQFDSRQGVARDKPLQAGAGE